LRTVFGKTARLRLPSLPYQIDKDAKALLHQQAKKGIKNLLNAGSSLLDLAELQLNRRRTSKDQDGNTQTVFVIINFFNDTIKIVERTISNPHHFAGLEDSLGLRLLH